MIQTPIFKNTQTTQTTQHYISVVRALNSLRGAYKDEIKGILPEVCPLEWVELVGGEIAAWGPWGNTSVQVEWLWQFDEDGIVETLDMTVVGEVHDEDERAAILQEILERYPGAYLSPYYFDDFAEASAISVRFDPDNYSSCWLEVRFQLNWPFEGALQEEYA